MNFFIQNIFWCRSACWGKRAFTFKETLPNWFSTAIKLNLRNVKLHFRLKCIFTLTLYVNLPIHIYFISFFSPSHFSCPHISTNSTQHVWQTYEHGSSWISGTDKPAFTGKPGDLYSADAVHTQRSVDSISVSLLYICFVCRLYDA